MSRCLNRIHRSLKVALDCSSGLFFPFFFLSSAAPPNSVSAEMARGAGNHPGRRWSRCKDLAVPCEGGGKPGSSDGASLPVRLCACEQQQCCHLWRRTGQPFARPAPFGLGSHIPTRLWRQAHGWSQMFKGHEERAPTSDLCDLTSGSETLPNSSVTEGAEQEIAVGLGSQAFQGALPCAK